MRLLAGKPILFRIFCVVLIFSALGCQRPKPDQAILPADSAAKAPAAAVAPADLAARYESDLRLILAPYWQKKNFAGLKDQILELRAPADYLDLHLNLVMAFELIEQGQKNADAEKIEAGMDKISQLSGQYPWLQSEQPSQ